MNKVVVIVGSIREGRIGRHVAEWVIRQIPDSLGLETELVDLAEWNLPLADEAGVPALGVYTQEHTKAWSRKVAAADGFVFVTPQYNWGYPASLKNALDHLYNEWSGKPAAIVSYGFHGGGKAAAQLRQVLEGLHMQPATQMAEITITREMHGEDGKIIDIAGALASYSKAVVRAGSELAILLQTPPPAIS